MKNITLFLSALVALLFSVAETSAQITPPYYNPANVRITGGTINGTTVGATTAATGSFTNVKASQSLRSENSGVPPGSSGPGLEIVGGATSYLQAYNRTTSAYSPLVLLGSLVTVGSPLSVTDTTDSSSTTTGALRTAGGLGVAKKSYFGDSLVFPSSVTNTGIDFPGRGTSSASLFHVGATGTDAYISTASSTGTGTGVNVGSDAYALNFRNDAGFNFGNGSAYATIKSSGLFVGSGTIQVGSGSATSAGLIAGYLGSSGYGAIWSTGVSPSTTNSALNANSTATTINAPSNVFLRINEGIKVEIGGTYVSISENLFLSKTITAAGTTGAQTINKTTGRVNFAAAATSLVVTNSLATANSICHVTKATNDATMRLGACVAAAGSITIYADVAPAAETAVNFTVTN